MADRKRTTLACPLFAVLAVVAACSGGAAPAADGTRQSQTHRVVMEGTAFLPPSVTIRAGDTIEWTNRDFFPHTATSADAKFDSKSIDAGGSWKQTLTERGAFAYVCTLHPTMKGAVKVE